MEKPGPKIVIIGAGVAGIAAATSLLDKGFENVIVLEAEERLGGRIHTVPFGERHVDLGAHWIHGEVDNAVFDMVKKMDIVCSSGDFTCMFFLTDDGRSIPSEIGMTLFARSGNLLEDEVLLKNAPGTLEDYLIPRCRELGSSCIEDKELLEAFLNWVAKFECTIEGCDKLSDVSAAGLSQYSQCDGDPILCWKNGGYYNIIDVLLRQHPTCTSPPVSLEGRLKLNSEVTLIDWGGLSVYIKCSDGQQYKADHVIITVSLGVLKERYDTWFKPALPVRKMKAIMGLGIGTVNKIYLRFSERWWPANCSGFSLMWVKKDHKELLYSWEREIIGFYIEYGTDPNVMGAWIVGESAREMEIYSDKEVLLACHRVLKIFLKDKFEIPEPIEVVRSQWFSNRNFRGSYSYRSLNTEVLETSADVLAEPLSNIFDKELLFFAGEATHNHFYSTVHGALESGWREARRIVEKYPCKNTELKKCSL